MNIKLTLPTELTTHMMTIKGDKSLAAYVVHVLQQYHHEAKEVYNEEGSATTRSYHQSNSSPKRL